LHSNYINVNTLLVRRSVVGDALHFGIDIPTYEDWECFARLTRAGNCAYLDVDTALQRSHSGPRLTDADPLNATRSRITLIERTWACDPEFMRTHEGEVGKLLATLRRTVLRQLIRLNRRDEARALLSQLGSTFIERRALRSPHKLLELLRHWRH
jgi:hypothetical protein